MRPRHCVWLLFSAVVFATGCGPSAEEQYLTALQIHEREQARLAELKGEYEDAKKLRMEVICRRSVGSNLEEIKLKQRFYRDNQEFLGGPNAPPEARQKSEAQLQEIKNELAVVDEFYNNAAKEGTKEYAVVQQGLAEMKVTRELKEQEERAAKAKQTLEEAERRRK